jgi:hypothetical protein
MPSFRPQKDRDGRRRYPASFRWFRLGFLGCRPEFCLSCPSTDCEATAHKDFINHRDSLPPPSKRFFSLSRRLFSASHFLCAATKKGRLTASKRLWQQSQNCVRLEIPQFRQPVWVMSPRYNQFRNALCRPANNTSLLSAGCQVSWTAAAHTCALKRRPWRSRA